MDVKIIPGQLCGTVAAIPSKSQAHRALICAALADDVTRVECEGESEDILATVACLSALGAGIVREPSAYVVQPMPHASMTAPAVVSQTVEAGVPLMLPCGESGSTFRFLLPIVGALGRSVSFLPLGRLPQRPLSPLYEELVRHGCTLSPQGAVPFYAAGKLAPGSYTLDAGVSSQFVSGLLFALPLLDGDSELRLTGRIESFPYIEMTLAMLDMFQIEAHFSDRVFAIPGGQVYRSPGTARVEGDWSNAAFWLTAGALGAVRGALGAAHRSEAHDGAEGADTDAADGAEGARVVTCTGLALQSHQGDRGILDILTAFGASVAAGDAAVAVSGGKLRSVEVDARDIPDLVPILAVAAALADGVTAIHNAGRLRTKESDRLTAVTDLLCGLGADVRESADALHIHGGRPLTGGEVSSWGDHRIVMAATIAATMCSAPVVIRGAEAVNKSYPSFFNDLQALGGKYEIL